LGALGVFGCWMCFFGFLSGWVFSRVWWVFGWFFGGCFLGRFGLSGLLGVLAWCLVGGGWGVLGGLGWVFFFWFSFLAGVLQFFGGVGTLFEGVFFTRIFRSFSLSALFRLLFFRFLRFVSPLFIPPPAFIAPFF